MFLCLQLGPFMSGLLGEKGKGLYFCHENSCLYHLLLNTGFCACTENELPFLKKIAIIRLK